MKFTITAAAVASLIPGIHGLTVNTPTASGLVVCQPISLTWTDGTAPYYLSVIPGGNAAAPALKIFDPTNGTSLTWKVDIAAGTSITLEIKDNTGTMAYSDAVSIQSASDTSCVTSSTSVSGQNSAVTATTSGSGVVKTSTSAGTISTTTAATTVSTSKATATTSKTAATNKASGSTASGGASPTAVINYGLAGLFGLFGILLV